MYHQHCKETKDTFTIPPPPKPSDHFQCARFVCILQSHVCIIFLLLLHFPLPSPLPPLFFLSISPPFSPPPPVLPLYLPSLLPSLPCSSSLSPLPSQYVTSRMHCSVGQAWASSGGCLITGLEYGTIIAERISARLWMRDLFSQCTCVRTYMSVTPRNVTDCVQYVNPGLAQACPN